MARFLDMLQILCRKRSQTPRPDAIFDQRLQKLGGVRRVSVARAVLFRTRPEPREA
ncbi:hypothetical protein [Xinfangfangia pollutisoli]|uniref:hypothetical protein n=1 Tax=Xinfangfangia pollutisoli TaxID=2865960 RepID=UPI001CD47DC7|nr:hypothetical protein [Xinfangfangia pollutisoli]